MLGKQRGRKGGSACGVVDFCVPLPLALDGSAEGVPLPFAWQHHIEAYKANGTTSSATDHRNHPIHPRHSHPHLFLSSLSLSPSYARARAHEQARTRTDENANTIITRRTTKKCTAPSPPDQTALPPG